MAASRPKSESREADAGSRASQSGPGGLLMMERLQARRAGDTARAQELTRVPEEVSERGSEGRTAAIASNRRPRATTRAPPGREKYLAAFPNGRFRSQAEQVLTNPR